MKKVAPHAGFEAAAIRNVSTAHQAFHVWLWEEALPFWADAGWDADRGGAREHLAADGSPAEPGFTRMRVQARQIYVFSNAALLGWAPGRRRAEDGYRFICAQGELPGGGWARRLSPDGGAVLDAALDLYDQAFVLLALAWLARLTGDAEPLSRARRTLNVMRARLQRSPAGFANADPHEPGPRRQNPHMHLLEAALALYETSGEAAWADLARELTAMFSERFLDSQTGALGEFFEDGWSPAPGPAGRAVEPGHQFEWVWLLSEHQRLLGEDLSGAAEALYASAVRHGLDSATGLVIDGVDREGRPHDRATRLWPQTEALKAHCVMARRGMPAAEARVVACMQALGARFLSPAPTGCWIDQLDANGNAKVDKIPTSSLYHLFMAYAELRRLACEPAFRRMPT